MSIAFTARSVARSHIGSVRAVNEDRILNMSDRQLWAVADGMGGHAMGDIAAQTVIATLAEWAVDEPAMSVAHLGRALAEANRRVIEFNGSARQRSGSTVAGLCLSGSDAIVFWAGDSRVYRQRDGSITLLTHDHRVVQELIDAGLIDRQQARSHPQGTIITRAIGAGTYLELATHVSTAKGGDVYLLCSDGLSDSVDDDLIGAAFSYSDVRAAKLLLDAALAAGGTDNISFVIVTLGVAAENSADDTLVLVRSEP